MAEKALSKEDIIKAVENMTVLELSELVKELEEKFEVSASVPMAMAPVAGSVGAAPEADEEKTEFDVVLVSFGEKKINVVKEVRSMTDLGLKEAKDLVESAPVTVKEAVKKEEADEMKKKLEDAGATVELK